MLTGSFPFRAQLTMSQLGYNISIRLDQSGNVLSKTAERISTPDHPSPNNHLNTMDGFDNDITNALHKMNLPSLTTASPSTLALWKASTTGPPRLFPSSTVWSTPPPLITTLILSTLDHLSATPPENREFTTYIRGEVAPETTDPRLAIAQLAEPDANSSMLIIGMKLDEVKDSMLHVPQGLSEHVESYQESGHQLLVVPRGGVSDLHVDAADGISVPIGSCKKVWIAFPPTPHNLKIFASQEGRRAKIQRIGHRLEGGVLFETTSAEAVYLPVGCIHGVFTTSGGFLNTLNFTSPDSIKTYPALITARADRRSEDFAAEVMKYFLECVNWGLGCGKEITAIEAWIECGERVREQGGKEREWKAKANGVWREWLETEEAGGVTCPCGKMEQGNFVNHFLLSHMFRKTRRGRDGGRRRAGLPTPELESVSEQEELPPSQAASPAPAPSQQPQRNLPMEVRRLQNTKEFGGNQGETVEEEIRLVFWSGSRKIGEGMKRPPQSSGGDLKRTRAQDRGEEPSKRVKRR
ncbi:hypothetical protein BJ875DRAFT_500199 [Amylocarpus encephaloides]|uniref:JmjC domain-containing protein n=1 Tax=Amylocarpus encephaloides TaxID=45428 RepID=A0A9P7Y985_9HELO|nr:hypothetical protein BJ875DRAFT_500199 [Amylocarpus encephaloides]